jgi:hypothetical protein
MEQGSEQNTLPPPPSRLEWKSSRGLFICISCLRGFKFDEFDRGRTHTCSDKAPIIFRPDLIKKSKCTGCGTSFYYGSPQLHLHICRTSKK